MIMMMSITTTTATITISVIITQLKIFYSPVDSTSQDIKKTQINHFPPYYVVCATWFLTLKKELTLL
jgi:hypothetical protein